MAEDDTAIRPLDPTTSDRRLAVVLALPPTIRRLAGVGLRAVLPVVGVALFGWDAWTIILLYWIETWFIGIDAGYRILVAEGQPDIASGRTPMESSSRGCLLSGFVLLFLVQLWFTGSIVLVWLPRAIGGGSIDAPLAFCAAVLASALAQWWDHRQFMETEEFLNVTPDSQGREPMKRLTAIWVTVFAASLVGGSFPGLARPLAVIVGKMIAEVMAEYEIGVFAPGERRASG